MATSLQTNSLAKYPALILATAFTPPAFAQAPACPSISRTIIIHNWTSEIPKSVQLIAYKKGTSFQEPIRGKSPEYGAQLTAVKNASLGNVLVLNPLPESSVTLSSQDDYNLVTNGKTEYLIHDIESSNEIRLGCPLESAKVNQCDVPPGKFIEFDQSCRQ